MNLFFTSDLHFYHKNVIAYCNRPFKDVDHMNETMIANWNAVIAPDDWVYILGDFVFGGTTKLVGITSRLNGRKFLIYGNHDDKITRNPARAKEFGFESMLPKGCAVFANEMVLMSHYPYRDQGDSTDIERYPERRLIDEGRWLLHGHVHEKWKIKNKMINVGVDVWDYKPVHISEIERIIRNAV